METLYYGSHDRTNVLIPPMNKQGKPSNFLFADTDKNKAIHDAFAALLRRHYRIRDYQVDGDYIHVSIIDGTHPTKAAIDTWYVYLYQIKSDRLQWMNRDGHALCTQYLTNQMIFSKNFKISTLSIGEWLRGKTIRVCNVGMVSWV